MYSSSAKYLGWPSRRDHSRTLYLYTDADDEWNDGCMNLSHLIRTHDIQSSSTKTPPQKYDGKHMWVMRGCDHVLEASVRLLSSSLVTRFLLSTHDQLDPPSTHFLSSFPPSLAHSRSIFHRRRRRVSLLDRASRRPSDGISIVTSSKGYSLGVFAPSGGRAHRLREAK